MWYHTDKYMYKLLDNYISPSICFIHPNYITYLRIVPMYFIHKYIQESNKKQLLIFMLISVVLDSLDGSVARTCNKKSKTGEILDTVMDITQNSLLIYYASILYISKYKFILPSLYILCHLLTFDIFNLDDNHNSTNTFFNLQYYNSVLLYILLWYIIIRKF